MYALRVVLEVRRFRVFWHGKFFLIEMFGYFFMFVIIFSKLEI